MSHDPSQYSRRLAGAFHSIVFCCVLILFCMPVLPTTDGPIHRYYVGVLQDVLSHSGSVYDHAYALRHPFPPYALQYFVMVGLARIWDVNTAEKVFAIATVLVTAYGFRSLARALGKNGDAISLGVSGLLLPWSLWMGFFNYTMAVGLSLVALSLWVRARAGRKALWAVFVVVCVLLAVTHPVPLMVLLLAISLDLGVSLFKKRAVAIAWDAIGMLLFVVILMLYPFFIGGGTHSATTFQDYGFHLRRIGRQLLLFGLSPYSVASREVLPNLYRVALYALTAATIYLGWTAWKQARRTSSLGFVNLLLPAGVLLGLLVLVLPNGISGSFFFATRLITFVSIAFLLSASDVEFSSGAMRRGWLMTVCGLFVTTVLAASACIWPAARQIAALNTERVPVAGAGLIIDPSQDSNLKESGSLVFNPYHWAGAIPLARSHQLMLNSPWLEQAILPLTFRAGSPLLNAQVTREESSAINLHDGTVRWLTQGSMRAFLAPAVVIFLRTPTDSISLSDQIGNVNASQFSCSSRSWYEECVRKPGAVE